MDVNNTTMTSIHVLTERVDHVLKDVQEMKGQLSMINQAFISMASMQEKVNHMEDNFNKLFNAINDMHGQLSRLQAEVRHQGWMWKLLGTVLIVCVSIVGWTATQYQSFNALVTRVAVLEHIVQTQIIKSPYGTNKSSGNYRSFYERENY